MQIDFTSYDGVVRYVASPDTVRPFTVGHDVVIDGKPMSVTNYYVRVDVDGVNKISTEQLFKELSKAVEVSKETYEAVMKAKRTWCEHQVISGKISPFAVTPGMVNQHKEVSKC